MHSSRRVFDSTMASTSDLGKASSGDVEISEKLPRGKNDLRADLMAQSRIAPNVLVSQQSCSLRENFGTLLKLRQSAKIESEINKINGLMAVLQHLASLKIDQTGKEISRSFLTTEDALELYLGYDTEYVTGTCSRYDRQRFQYALLHPKYGLCVYIINPPQCDSGYIVLRSDDVDLSSFFVHLSDVLVEKLKRDRLLLTKETVQLLLKSMDSEWDKSVARVILGAVHTNAELDELGITSDTIAAVTRNVLEVSNEIQNAQIAAQDMVTLNIKEKITKGRAAAEGKQHLLQRKQSVWPPTKLQELEEEIEELEGNVKDMKLMLEGSSKQHHMRLQRMCKRKADNLIESNRLKRRRLADQGNNKLINVKVVISFMETAR